MTNVGNTLEAVGLRKSYGGITALNGVSFRARAGSVHALVGENGAGKSTLVKMLVGAIAPDAGTLRLDGRAVRFSGTAAAAAHGIAIVSQELSLFPDLDILANMFPLREPRWGPFISRTRMAKQAEAVLHDLGLAVDLHRPASSLSLEQSQLLEIARALTIRPRVLILDEPTSALHTRETERLHAVLRTLRQRNVAVVYISHILEDVLSLCDEVTILRDGESVLYAAPASELKIDEIVHAMLGNKIAPQTKQRSAPPDQFTPGQNALHIENVTIAGSLQNVTMQAPAGAIIGITGLSGSGYRDILAIAAGLTRPDKGHVRLPDGSLLRHNMRSAVKQGVALVPGDRKRIGLMLDKPLWDNIAQVQAVALQREGLFLRKGKLRSQARNYVNLLGINTPSVDQEVGRLSGGNQQKVVFAKWLEAKPAVLLLDDPTRGIDIGAKAEIYNLMHGLAEQGTVQVLASTDPWELATVCDRVFVFYNGHISAVLAPPYLDASTILEVMNTGKEPSYKPEQELFEEDQ